MDRELLHVKVIREIISFIAQGHYPVGQRIPAERKLCDQFHVSRGTLRQALGDLEKMGLLDIRPGSGAYVKAYSPKKLPTQILPPEMKNLSVRDIVIARRAIELPAFELACENIRPEHLSRLNQLLELMADSLDHLPDFFQHDFDFHQTIVLASGNMPLYTALQAISEYHKYSQIFTGLEEDSEHRALEYHHQIFTALRNKQTAQGRRILEEHLNHLLDHSAQPL